MIKIRPIGVYGSKTEIVKFFETTAVADSVMYVISVARHIHGLILYCSADLLRNSSTEPNPIPSPSLRSGLYLLKAHDNKLLDPVVYAVYWPEDTTWDDTAVSAIHRNRVTFMR
jgi:hypothetical protein